MARIKRLGRIKAQKLDSKALSTTPFYERPTRQKKLDEKQLYLLAQSLLPIESIARIMSCNPDLIYTRYADLLQKGRDDRKHSLVQAMWHQALYEKDTKSLLAHYPESIISRFNADQKPLEVLRDVLLRLSNVLSHPEQY